jgi:hypothetical protein
VFSSVVGVSTDLVTGAVVVVGVMVVLVILVLILSEMVQLSIDEKEMARRSCCGGRGFVVLCPPSGGVLLRELWGVDLDSE